MSQRTVSRVLTAHPKATARTGILYPHKVPPSLANHGIEDRGC
jgi:hypothetical protein